MGWRRTGLELLVRAAAWTAPRLEKMPAEPRSIFVLRNNDLGDVLVISPLFAALRRRFPKARLIAGVGSWAAPLLEGNPHLDEVLTINAPWHNHQVQPQGLRAAWDYLRGSPEIATLAARRCEIGIDVLGSGLGSLLLMRAGIPWRLGVRGYAGGHSAAQQVVAFTEPEHVGRMALRFAELLGATELPENRPQLFCAPEAKPGRTVVIAPGGGFAEKCWPVSYYAALLDRLAPHQVVIIGSDRDRATGAELSAGRSHVTDCTGRTSLQETAKMIAEAAVVITNPSLAMHLAAAFRRPCVTLLGPHFLDAEQHARQWTYPETRSFGRSPAHPEIWTPEEVWPAIRELLPAP